MVLPKNTPLHRALGGGLVGGKGLEKSGLKAPDIRDVNKEQEPSNMHSRNLQGKKIKKNTLPCLGRKILDALTTQNRNYHQA